jgi:hypothetical protein
VRREHAEPWCVQIGCQATKLATINALFLSFQALYFSPKRSCPRVLKLCSKNKIGSTFWGVTISGGVKILGLKNLGSKKKFGFQKMFGSIFSGFSIFSGQHFLEGQNIWGPKFWEGQTFGEWKFCGGPKPSFNWNLNEDILLLMTTSKNEYIYPKEIPK